MFRTDAHEVIDKKQQTSYNCDKSEEDEGISYTTDLTDKQW